MESWWTRGRGGMDGSIAHPDPVTRRAALESVLAALDGELRDAAAKAGDAAVAASVREFAQLLGSINPRSSEPARDAGPERLVVCRFWEASLRAASEVPRALVAAAGATGPSSRWPPHP